MHKDKPPGILNIAERPVRHAVTVCFVAGFIVSILARIVYLLVNQEHAMKIGGPW